MASELEFPNVLAQVVAEASCNSEASVDVWKRKPTAIARIGGLIAISSLGDMPKSLLAAHTRPEESRLQAAFIIVRGQSANDEKAAGKDSDRSEAVYELIIPGDKRNKERAFKACLPGCLDFMQRHLQECRKICIACDTGTELSVGIALTALRAFFDDEGGLDIESYHRKDAKGAVYMRWYPL